MFAGWSVDLGIVTHSAHPIDQRCGPNGPRSEASRGPVSGLLGRPPFLVSPTHRELLRLSERTAARLRASGSVGRTVSIKVRFADFTTITRAKTLREPTDVARVVYETGRALYEALGLQRARIRLVGVRLEGLVPRERVHRQLLLGQREHGWSEADRAADRVVRRFGADAVRPASLLS